MKEKKMSNQQLNTTTTPAAPSMVQTNANEMAVSSMVAKAQAEVQARYVMAYQRPRNMDLVRTKILHECARPLFAENAMYEKPVGGQKIHGLSIRFVEAALRIMGNVHMTRQVISDGEDTRTVRIGVTDLETNSTYETDFTIEKTVERRSIKEGQPYIATRTNTYGDTLYILRGTSDDVLQKESAQASKVLRTLGERLIPSDIIFEAKNRIARTVDDADAQDPDAAKKKLIDAFGRLRISPDKLVEYLGHDLDALAPGDLANLRLCYTAINDGEATWHEMLAAKKSARNEPPEAEPQPTEPPAPVSKSQEMLKTRNKKPAEEKPPWDKHMPMQNEETVS